MKEFLRKEYTPVNSGSQETEDLLRNAERYADFIEKTFKNHEDNRARSIIMRDIDMNRWGSVLFNAARRSTGVKKIRYATTLQKFAVIDPRKYSEALNILLTTPEAVVELIVQGNREKSPIMRVKKFFQK